jgi:hypothetical protein
MFPQLTAEQQERVAAEISRFEQERVIQAARV